MYCIVLYCMVLYDVVLCSCTPASMVECPRQFYVILQDIIAIHLHRHRKGCYTCHATKKEGCCIRRKAKNVGMETRNVVSQK